MDLKLFNRAMFVVAQLMILLLCAALISHSSREYELFGSMAGFYYTGFMLLLLELVLL